MAVSENILSAGEAAAMKLRSLYESYGYKKFKMSKFEEYDLYAENKSFLSGGIITFTDFSGRLMALKPDVTLSIAKNIPSEGYVYEKVYYSENVYRAAPGSAECKEIMQVGVECIGDVDLGSICEVVLLASESLAGIGSQYVLDMSHLGFVAGLLDEAELAQPEREMIGELLERKNAHGIREICERKGVGQELTELLTSLPAIGGPYQQALESAKRLNVNARTHAALAELTELFKVMEELGAAGCLNLDFSLVNNMSYYNGIIFQGFIRGIPNAVLSGGSYGFLMSRLGKQADAVGFAIYLNLLDDFEEDGEEYDADVLLLYSVEADIPAVEKERRRLIDEGMRVRVQKSADGKLRCRRVTSLKEGRFETIG